MRSRVVGDAFWSSLEQSRVQRFGHSFMGLDIMLRFSGDAAEIRRFYASRDKRRAA
jgi:hypothetical protein